MKRFDEKIDVYISSSNNDRTAHISPAKGSYHRYILHKAHLARTTSFSLLSVDRRLKGRQRAVYRLLVLIPLFILPYSHIYIHIPSIVSRDFIIAARPFGSKGFFFFYYYYTSTSVFLAAIRSCLVAFVLASYCRGGDSLFIIDVLRPRLSFSIVAARLKW